MQCNEMILFDFSPLYLKLLGWHLLTGVPTDTFAWALHKFSPLSGISLYILNKHQINTY